MGRHDVAGLTQSQAKAEFLAHLLNDIKALDHLLATGQIESGITRIGAEQEFCLTDAQWQPAHNAPEILAEITDPHFTSELARYNLEINLDPLKLEGKCFSEMEQALKGHLQLAKKHVEAAGSRILLTGILPTIGPKHLELDYMTPSPRYYALNDMIKHTRGSDFQLHIRGVEELSILHDSVLFEACNTSFQMHLQIDPEDFISSFNWAQALAGPILGICTNSPLLLGRELWKETRIALFRQSIDTRPTRSALINKQPRVQFGTAWAQGDVSSIFRNEIAAHTVILHHEIKEDALRMARAGQAPKLEALNLHNGTLYNWNRACYGVGGGKAHLRIENRYVPSGPTVQDEMANFALWVGLMKARPSNCDDMITAMDFKSAKNNFLKAARYGSESVMEWMGESLGVKKLIGRELLPMAESGLKSTGINPADIQRYLTIIDKRLHAKDGSKWIVSNYREASKKYGKDAARRMLSKTMFDYQQEDNCIADWGPLCDFKAMDPPERISQIMSTGVITVREDDLAALATSIMDWKNIHHVPVVDRNDSLIGLLTWTHVIHTDYAVAIDDGLSVGDIMVKAVVSVAPDTDIQEAIKIMKHHEIGCLPVTEKGTLVGIVTIKDIQLYDPEPIDG